MAFTLTVTTPDGSLVTTSRPITYGPQVVLAVAHVLHGAAPWMTRRQRDAAGWDVARGRKGVPLVHQESGLVFRVDVIDDQAAARPLVAAAT